MSNQDPAVLEREKRAHLKGEDKNKPHPEHAPNWNESLAVSSWRASESSERHLSESGSSVAEAIPSRVIARVEWLRRFSSSATKRTEKECACAPGENFAARAKKIAKGGAQGNDNVAAVGKIAILRGSDDKGFRSEGVGKRRASPERREFFGSVWFLDLAKTKTAVGVEAGTLARAPDFCNQLANDVVGALVRMRVRECLASNRVSELLGDIVYWHAQRENWKE